MILDSIPAKREQLKVVPLKVGQRGLLAGGPKVLMMFDFNSTYKNKKRCSLENLVLISMFSSLSLEFLLIM